jgi:hypothetical protein
MMSAPRPRMEVMQPFVELRLDPNWPGIVRRTLLAQTLDYFRPYFRGRCPSESEKLAYIENAVRLLTPVRAFANNLYKVEIFSTPAAGPDFIHLGISRHDGGTCKEWRDIQRIKNEIVGPEYEAIELFPAESRLVDAGDQYHLWVHKDPGFRFPVGWQIRVVREHRIPLVLDGEERPQRAA